LAGFWKGMGCWKAKGNLLPKLKKMNNGLESMAMNEENEGLLMVKATQKSHGSADERSGILTGIDRVFAAGQAVFRQVRHFDGAQCRQAHRSQARHAAGCTGVATLFYGKMTPMSIGMFEDSVLFQRKIFK